MKKKVLALIVLFTVCLNYSIYGRESVSSDEVTSDSSVVNKFSIGINNLPWDATRVSLRWWKDKSGGRDLSVGYFIGSTGKTDENLLIEANLAQIRYDWLRRKKSGKLDGLYIIRGIGMGTAFRIRSHELDEERKRDEITVFLSLYIPVGIEHFFLHKYPNISYSIQADFYGTIGYDYRHDPPSESKTNIGHLSLGITPRFFLRFYFK